MKLTTIQKDAINLVSRSKDKGDGWRKCAPKIFGVITEALPAELLEREETSLRVRLTHEGEAVAKWLC